MDFNFFGTTPDDEDKLLFRSIADKIYLAQKHYSPKFTFFLDERQCDLVERVLKNSGVDNFVLYGGYENAKRKILALCPPYGCAEKTDFPLKSITISYRNADAVSHRDILGSIMALNVERKTVGDIVVGDNKSCVVLYETIFDEVFYGLKKIGRSGVKVTEGFDESLVKEEKFQEIKGTVASLRADCILSLALNLSREKCADIIRQKGVVVNFKEQFSVSYQMKEMDVFSVKGYGKFIFSQINGTTKKDRLHIIIKKYI